MKDQYYPPTYKAEQFHCINCGVYAKQRWNGLSVGMGDYSSYSELEGCRCDHCERYSYWCDGKMIHPAESPIEPHHPDMPDECKQYYEEASSLSANSPLCG